MHQRVDALRQILFEPLDYMHPDRGVIPHMFELPAARAVLNRCLLRSLSQATLDLEEFERGPWTDLWVAHWQRLPDLACLMGAQLLWPQLARGARLRELDAFVRSFARMDLGNRRPIIGIEGYCVARSVSAVGLGSLIAWHPHIPDELIQRLFLQFSPRVVELQQSLPAQIPNPLLLILAVQHARIHQTSC